MPRTRPRGTIPDMTSPTPAGPENITATLAAYDAHIPEYLAGTPTTVTGPLKQWLDTAVHNLDPASRILELGTGTGRDAAYLEQHGYTVHRTDAADGFLHLLRAHGHAAEKLDAIHDPIPPGQHLILADAVLVHFTVEQTRQVLAKTAAALAPGGRFAFTLKTGTGAGWTSEKLTAPRYFQYWTQDAITRAATDAGYTRIQNTSPEPGPWLHLIAHT